MKTHHWLTLALPLALAACATTGNRPTATLPAASDDPAQAAATAPPPRTSPYAPAQEDPGKRGDYVAGGLFQPGVPDTIPAEIPDVDAIPEPEVRDEPRARTGNRDYVVQGRRYHVLDDQEGYAEEGVASFYGNKFHGRRTSSSEVYDMYAFTAAHKTLPLPSYVRVTNLDNGRSVIVRVNDRGPFHSNRIIDLSYAAAVKLGYRERGTARVRVEALTAEDMVARPSRPVRPATAMDRLVAGLPSAAAVGPAPDNDPVPAPASPAAVTVAAAASATRTVDSQPRNSAPAVVTVAAAASATHAVAAQTATPPAPGGNRFYMQQGGRNMTAAEFDAWMGQRGIRVATGRPLPVRSPAPAAAAAPPPEPVALPQIASASVAAAPASAPESADMADAVVLQVASFSNEVNAQHALSVLHGAAIAQARLLAADIGGRHVWRLRVGPIDPEAEAELASRIEGLGLGRPQRVND